MKGNLVEPLTHVHNSESLMLGWILRHILDEGEGVLVGQGGLIELTLNHNEVPFSFFFLGHNEASGRPL